MARKKSKVPVEHLFRGIDFPHLRDGGKWIAPGKSLDGKHNVSFGRLCHYAKELRKLGMLDGDISCMLSDLYWDAVTEYTLNKQAHPVIAISPTGSDSTPFN